MGSLQPPSTASPTEPAIAVARHAASRDTQLVELVGRLRERIDQQSSSLQAVDSLIRELPIPCLVTDQAGRCLDGNQAFLRALGTGTLQLQMGRVRFDDPSAQQDWDAALLETYATGIARSVRLVLPANGVCDAHLRPWLPLEAGEAVRDQRLLMAVFETRGIEAHPATSSVSNAGLTHAELQVLASLLKGLPAKSIAGLRGASVNTVRSQIMTILEKTGFRSQKELLASFGSSTFADSMPATSPDGDS
jgi:DNA-binding CsgD family transcriptional regulator